MGRVGRFIFRVVTVLASVGLLGALVCVAAYRAYTYYFLTPRDPSNIETVVFDTETARGLRQVARTLEEQGIIRSGLAFRMLARFEKKDTQIKAGEYALAPSMTPQQILDIMVRGDTIPRRATIREGMTISDISAIVEQAGIVDRASFEEALADPRLRQDLGIEAHSFEGYLFPETYNFRRNTHADQVIRAMYDQLHKHWTSEWDSQAARLGMSKHQILTLASIVEKESGNFDEQPIIASVFHNRLKLNMRLQADPTVIYGIKNFNGNITKRDLQTETPYNTYIIPGLPPGPIANPGFSAIKAALFPTDTRYLYFVGNGEGRHVFSENLDQHNDAVNRYQRGVASRAARDGVMAQPVDATVAGTGAEQGASAQ
jgi:UPF0755 protein